MQGERTRATELPFRGRLLGAALVLLAVSAAGYAWLGSSAAQAALWVLLGAIAVGCVVRSCGLGGD